MGVRRRRDGADAAPPAGRRQRDAAGRGPSGSGSRPARAGGTLRSALLGRSGGSAAPDPYEFAAARMDAARTGRSMGTDTGPPGADVVPSPTRRSRLLLVVVAVLVLAGVARTATRGGGDSALAASCTTPGLRLAESSVHRDSPTSFTAAGPADLQVVVAVGAASLRRGPDGRLVPVAARGVGGAQLASPQRQLGGCRGSGTFGVQVPPGAYTVTLFEVGPAGSTQALATAPLTVTRPRTG